MAVGHHHLATVRKLTRRLGAEVVHELTRLVIAKARREKRFRPRAARIDATVVEADIKYPTDAGLAADGVRALAREGRKLAAKIGAKRTAVRDRSRAVGVRMRALTRTIRRRSGEAKAEVLELTKQTGTMLRKSVKEARALAAAARSRARGRGARAKLKAARALEDLADRCEKVTEQITKRVKDEKITDRLVSLWDPDARPIRKGKLGKPNEFGYVDQLCEITQNTKPGARGFILPPVSQIGNPAENALLPQTAEQLRALDITLREVMVDGGFTTQETNTALEGLADEIYIAGRQEAGSRKTRRRRKRYRTGAEGRISHLKRGYGCADPASKATTATKSGTAGRPSPTTQTPTPPSAEEIRPGASEPSPRTPDRRTKTGCEPQYRHPRRHQSGILTGHDVYPGEVATRSAPARARCAARAG